MKLITKILHHEQVKPQFSPMWKPQPLLHSHCAKLLDLIWKHMFSYEKHAVLLILKYNQKHISYEREY